jgi:hypothetical protein
MLPALALDFILVFTPIAIVGNPIVLWPTSLNRTRVFLGLCFDWPIINRIRLRVVCPEGHVDHDQLKILKVAEKSERELLRALGRP